MAMCIIYFVGINLLAFFLYGIDKYKASLNKWRIPEATLIVMSLFGGGLGSWLGMKVFRHKTKKLKFRLIVPLMTIIWTGLFIYLIVILR